MDANGDPVQDESSCPKTVFSDQAFQGPSERNRFDFGRILEAALPELAHDSVSNQLEPVVESILDLFCPEHATLVSRIP